MDTNNTNNQSNPSEVNVSNQEKISGLWNGIRNFLHELLDIRQESDRDETIESVRKDISFQGHNAWILIFSIFVASVGLNADSTAVVIGAMLISPLMGPIVGMGLGTAINDEVMLKRSMTNLAVMVGLSLITASLFFFITPIKTMTSELFARTAPNVLDVLVAIFGGLALIVAKAKKGTISNAIAGVAIATALMPPLCTAGYGIAIWDFGVFIGAMYLFCINTVFIALSTYVVCKLLKFPMVKYANQLKRKRVSQGATLLGVIVLAPSIFLFWQLYKDQMKQIAITNYTNNYIQYDGMRPSFDWNKDNQTLDVVMMGAPVPQSIVDDWQKKFSNQDHLEDATVRFYQGSSMPETTNGDVELVQEELIDKLRLIQDKVQHITALENQIRRLNDLNQNFNTISQEVQINYPDIASISYAQSVNKDFITQQIDTLSIYNIRFRDSTATDNQREPVIARMTQWLKLRLNSDRISVKVISSDQG